MTRMLPSMVPGVVRDATGLSRSDDVAYEFLAFKLGVETYALPLDGVQEILKLPRITRVPRASHEILGIVSVRGRVTTVIDLRRRLRVPEGPLDKNTRVLLVEAGNEVLGMLVDAVLQVYRLYEDEVELASAVGGDLNEYVMGIGRPRAVRTLGRSSNQDRSNPHDILILLHAEPLLRR
ncbi:MAG: Positive regulator of CheA protein [Myxococcaceae bacterium]|nr:Positive regulator of CheA protein [Myxococcaceae bacterium]